MIYLDTNVLIRLVEGDEATRQPVVERLEQDRVPGRFMATSILSRLECRVLPLRNSDAAVLSVYDGFFASDDVQILDVAGPVVELATALRANRNLKTVDALHVASAVLSGASLFLTGDRRLARCTEIPVEIL